MRAYVAVTGVLFVLIVISHVVRFFVEKGVVHDVAFILVTLVPVILAWWAGILLRKNPSPVRSNV
jgi:hypothetical protein